MSKRPTRKDLLANFLQTRKKSRPDSRLSRMTVAQREALEEWLLGTEPPLTLQQASDRLAKEFNITASTRTLSRWYPKLAQRRILDSIGDTAKDSNEVMAEFEKHPHDTYKALLALLGKFAFEKARNQETKDPIVIDLTKLMITAKREERAVDQLKLAREKFHFGAAKAAKEHAEAIHAISRNSALDDEQKVQAVMLTLFGAPPPK